MTSFVIFGLIIIGLFLAGYFVKKSSSTTKPAPEKNNGTKKGYYEKNIEQFREGKVKVFNKVEVIVTKVPNEYALHIEPNTYSRGKTEIDITLDSIDDKNGNVKILARKRTKPSEEWQEEEVYDVIMGAS